MYVFTTGNELSYHTGEPFSTQDVDNDDNDAGSCAVSAHGAWWYVECLDSNLFGVYGSLAGYDAMLWKYFYADAVEYSPVKTVKWMIQKS